MQLGTNGTVDPADFDRMMQLLADRKKVVLINAKVPRPWEQQVNDTLAAGVEEVQERGRCSTGTATAARTPSSSTTTGSTCGPRAPPPTPTSWPRRWGRRRSP